MSSLFTVQEAHDTYQQRVDDIRSGDVVGNICMDVAFLLRLMEECRESVKTDVELHVLLEKVLQQMSTTEVLTMENYAEIVPQETQPENDEMATTKEEALIKGWAKYEKFTLKKSKLVVTTKAGREIELRRGDKFGLRLSSNGKLHRMITERYGPTIIVTLTHPQAEQIRRAGSVQG